MKSFVEFPYNCNNLFNFKLDEQIAVRKHTNGFYSIHVSWNSDSIRGLDFSAECTGNGRVSMILENENFTFAHEGHEEVFMMEVGLETDEYVPVFFRNLKYAVEVWFAPWGWEEYDCAQTVN